MPRTRSRRAEVPSWSDASGGRPPGRGPFLGLAAVVALLAVLLLALRPEAVSPVRVRDFILSFGILAPVAYAALYLVGVFIPYGTTILTVAAGLAFGPLRGSLLTFSVTVFATLLPFSISRRLGRAWVEEKVGGTRVEKYAEKMNRNAFLVFFYLRLVPSLPYEAQNYIAGITRITTLQFFLATVLGIGPIILILAFLGDSLTDPGSPRFWLATGIYLSVLLGPAGGALLLRKLRKRRPPSGIGSS
jgi:uncharacterized membrane protein YdjX (TVP38/TMEM64 family)